ncbi:hypothetical protein [Aeromonas phage JELG-KS1]|uniref:Uncharacterized protein n=1 Tax=Aeromonas phage JELG-KS1 TaxID=2951233 RepID=A0A9E7NLK8_9CAUD|nr:hypothetical protein [Aeromonas phage JELG-KS1]
MTDFVFRLEATVYECLHSREIVVHLKDRHYGEHFEFRYSYMDVRQHCGRHSSEAERRIAHMAMQQLSDMWSPQP